MHLTISWINSVGEPLICKTINGLNLGDTVDISPVIPEVVFLNDSLTGQGMEEIRKQVDISKAVTGIRIQIEEDTLSQQDLP